MKSTPEIHLTRGVEWQTGIGVRCRRCRSVLDEAELCSRRLVLTSRVARKTPIGSENGDRRPESPECSFRVAAAAMRTLYDLCDSSRLLVDPYVPKNYFPRCLWTGVDVAPESVENCRGSAAPVTPRPIEPAELSLTLLGDGFEGAGERSRIAGRAVVEGKM